MAAAREASTPDDVLDGFLAGLPAESALVLVPHSNAGLYVPQLCAHRSVVANVFVDAAVPPAEGSTPLAPTALSDLLRNRVGADGLLPPWSRWWDDADAEALLPDQDVPSGWLDLPNAYVAFGDTYADERRQAEQRGWTVRTLAGRHLHMLVEPEEVTTTLLETLAALGLEAAR